MIDQRLQVLRVLAERGTVSAAAADLGYTPSAISHQLRTLARDVGAELLVPEGRGVRLTGAALTLLERTHDLFTQWEEIRADVQQASGTSRGYLRMAGFSTAASALLPPAAVAVNREFPQSTIRIIEADPEVCFDMLLADQVDLAVVVNMSELPPTADPRFEQERLMEDALDLLVHADSPLAARSRVRLADAAEEHWIMEHPGRPYHQLVAAACAAAGFTPEHAHEVVEWDTGAALVSAGFGVALVPRLARIPNAAGLVRIPLRGDASPVRHVRTSVRSGTSRQPEIACALAELRTVATSLAEMAVGDVG